MKSFGLAALGLLLSQAYADDSPRCKQLRENVSEQEVADIFQDIPDTTFTKLCNWDGKTQADTAYVANHYSNLTFTITNTGNDVEAPKDCGTPFNTIIEKCVSGGNYWGGTVLIDGFLFEVYHNDANAHAARSLNGRATAKTPTQKAKAVPAAQKGKTGKNPVTNPKKTAPTATQTLRKVKSTATPTSTSTSKACKLNPKTGKLVSRNGDKVETCEKGLPTIAEIRKQFKPTKDICVFYSGPNGYKDKAQIWANKQNAASEERKANPNLRYRILSSIWKDQSWYDPYAKIDRTEMDRRASRALAEDCTGIVHVMLPTDTKGKDWKKGTVWDVFEYPYLSSGVTKLIRINPDNDSQEEIPIR